MSLITSKAIVIYEAAFPFSDSRRTLRIKPARTVNLKAVLVVNVGGKLAQKFAFGVYELAAFGAFEMVVLAAFGVFAGVLIARAVAVAAREFSYLARGAQFSRWR